MSDNRSDLADTPPAGASFQPSGALGQEDVAFRSDAAGGDGSGDSGGKLDTAKQAVTSTASKLTGQAGDKARELAEQGKARANDALGNFSRSLGDLASQVDEKVGPSYGKYLRDAAGQIDGVADRIQAADVDELVDDVRDFVRRSPGVAIGAAAAVGFVLARLVQAGIDDRRV